MSTDQGSRSVGGATAHFVQAQMWTKLPYPTEKFTGKTIIVTGSNVGMGLEAVRHFVRLGAAKVIIAVRTLSKGEAAKASVLESEKCDASVVEVWELDLASYASTKAFARKALDLERLDVVVLNAGVYLYDFTMGEQDEMTVTVNVVDTFLLGIMLLPKLRATSVQHGKECVLTFTGSFVHFMTSFPERKAANIFEELADEKKARMNDR
jgi:retinol dehydrogenase-12